MRDFQERHSGLGARGSGLPEATLPEAKKPATPDALSRERERAGVTAMPDAELDAAAPWQRPTSYVLARLQHTARTGGNLFAELLQTVCSCSLGQITHALYEVGGQYRRSM